MTPENLSTQLADLNTALAPWSTTHFEKDIHPLLELQKEFAAKLGRFSAEEQRLSIGIMGQVKAGKSSFLNALLFDGRPVLPEAATPKTANLTRIGYGDIPLLEVSYYSADEWQAMEIAAASVGEHAEARVARELVAMARAQQLDVHAILARGNERLPAASVDALVGVLNSYAGENGKYTALVKATRLYLPLDVLKGFDVVDTPGMNDPVQSRTQKTREYMAECDVVFFLSRCPQFLDQADMELLARQLPGKGVKRMVLVACQADSGLMDNGYDRDSLAAAEADLTKRLNRRAMTEMEQLAQAREKAGSEYADVATLLRGLKTPVIASTFAHGFAAWPQETWGSSMHFVHGALTELAADRWDGTVFTKDDWNRIANFDALTAAYQQARDDKQALLAAQKEALLPEARRELKARLQQLIETVESHALQLRTGDIDKLEAASKACQQRIDSIAHRLAEQINQTLATAEATRRKMVAELQDHLAQASRLKTRTGTETQTHSREVSTSSWYKPWTWGDTRTVYSTTSRSYEYLAAADAVEQVMGYRNDSAARLQREFNQIVNPQQLKADLRRALLAELDTASADFDPGHFRSILEGTMSRVAVPVLSLALGDASASITRHFSGEVRSSSDMTQLRQALQQALETAFTQLLGAFEEGVATLKLQLQVLRDSLHQKLSADLSAELAGLREAFADKENELRQDERILGIARAALT